MISTYHAFLEDLYREARGADQKLRAMFDVEFNDLVETPSYHFGAMLPPIFELDQISTILAMASADATFIEKVMEVNEVATAEYVAAVAQLLQKLNLTRVALVTEATDGRQAFILVVRIVNGAPRFGQAYFDPRGGWTMMTEKAAKPMRALFAQEAARFLELLANPTIKHVMAPSSTGMERLTGARRKRGEAAVSDMQIVHLTKRIVIGGTVLNPSEGSHGAKSPHDRAGHWRHSEREISGWEEVQPTTGEYAGMTVWRKWINDTPIKGGKPKATAPQFRVVK